MQWIFHCFRVQIDSVGVFVWALTPFLCFGVFLLFGSLFPLAKRKSGWGICGVVAFGVVVVSLFCFNRFADFKDLASLYRCFCCLLSCKNRAISATSATLEEKKETTLEGARNQVGSQRKMFFLYGHFFIFLTKQWEEARVNIWYWTVVLLHDVRWD